VSIRRILRNKKFRKFVCCLASLTDFRQKGKIKHPLVGCLIIIILAQLSGCNYFRDFILFAKKNESKLKKFNILPHGIPSHDTLERVVQKVNKLELNISLVKLLFPSLKGRPIISIDGKCIRSTKNSSIKGTYQGMKDIVTMFMSESKLSLLSHNNSDKGNEMNVIPILLKQFHDSYPDVKPYITIDGIGITHEILTMLKEYGYDFVIVYKRSKDNIDEFSKILKDSLGEEIDIVKNSSRIEKRIFNLYSPEGTVGIEQWLPYITHIGKMSSKVENTLTNVITNNDYYYFVSDMTVKEFMNVRRHHWAIENSLHWILDNSFREDRMRIKKGSACENMNLLRKFVLNVIALTNLNTESVSAYRDSMKYDTPQELLYKIFKAIV